MHFPSFFKIETTACTGRQLSYCVVSKRISPSITVPNSMEDLEIPIYSIVQMFSAPVLCGPS
jgi:hypothetical protein